MLSDKPAVHAENLQAARKGGILEETSDVREEERHTSLDKISGRDTIAGLQCIASRPTFLTTLEVSVCFAVVKCII